MSEEWYLPRDIIFSREQCIWLISELLPLDYGIWPSNPLGSGYTDEPIGNRGHSHHASFETPCQITGELRARLESTKESGEALIDEVQGGLLYYDLLSRPARKALNYISGYRRRKQKFYQWKKQTKKRGNEYQKVVFSEID